MNKVTRLISVLCGLCLVFCLFAPVTVFSLPDEAAEILYGDVDQDGAVNIGDIALLAKQIAGWTDLGAFSFDAADVDLSKTLDLSDLMFLAKSVAGWAIELPVVAQPETKTVFCVSDSTGDTYLNADKSVMTQSDYRDIMGWGYYLDFYFGDAFNVVNLSKSGASSRTFVSYENYATLFSELKAGDYVLIQFGHNDDNTNYKGTETALDWHLADPETCYVQGAALPSFQATLYYKYLQPVLSRGAMPILASPVTRRNAANGKAYYSRHVPYANAMKALCTELDLTYLPIMETTSARWNGIWDEFGASGTASLHAFADETRTSIDNTHLSHYGAYVVAGLYADALCEKIPAFAAARYETPVPFDGVIPEWVQEIPVPEQTLWIMGDSTAQQYTKVVNGETVLQEQSDGRDIMGWGRYLGAYFSSSVTVKNCAHSGTSARTYAGAGLPEGSMIEYRKVLNECLPGDCVVIQFGHNDQTARGTYYYKGTIVPDESKGISFDWHDADPVTCMVEGYDQPSYQAVLYYYYIKPLTARGVTPILASPISRLGKGADTALHLPYAAALQTLAQELDLVYLPMTEATAECWNGIYASFGTPGVSELHAFSTDARTARDRTHLSHYGAYIVAGLYADALCEKIPAFAAARLETPVPFDGVIPEIFNEP